MNYIEMSIDNVEKETKKLYKKIINDYNYDLVIFIAKGSYIIGKELAKLNNVPLLEIFANRKGSKIKKVLSPLLKFFPKKILITLRKREVSSGYHKKNKNRVISFDIKKYESQRKKKKILLVDDSIDTGNSIIKCQEAIINYFKDAEVKIAVFNIMDDCPIHPDYTIFKNTMICGPWSNDSKYYSKFLKQYKKWKEDNK